MNLHGTNFIGDRLTSPSREVVHAVNPLLNTPLEPAFHKAELKDVDAVMALAESASLPYRHTTGEQRAVFLERIADEIMALGDDLLQRAHLETGLPEARLTGERARTCGQLKMFAQV